MLLMLLAPARAHGIRRLADEAGDCYVGDGSTYTGNVSVTANGTACQPWAEDTPHTHTHHHDLPSNYCRNPDGEPAPWCYTVSPDVQWELCDIPQCVSEEGAGNGNTSQSDGAAHVGGESSATVCTNTCSHPYDNECDDGGEGALQKRAKERSSTCAAHCMFILTRPHAPWSQAPSGRFAISARTARTAAIAFCTPSHRRPRTPRRRRPRRQTPRRRRRRPHRHRRQYLLQPRRRCRLNRPRRRRRRPIRPTPRRRRDTSRVPHRRRLPRRGSTKPALPGQGRRRWCRATTSKRCPD